MKAIFLYIFCLFVLSVSAQQIPKFVRTVYDDIYNTMDNGQVIKPALIYSNDPTEVATFQPAENQILIGVKLIKIARNFGADSNNVIAHVIGHELAHILLQQNDFIKKIGSGYASVSYNLQLKKIQQTLQDSVFERQADEYSALYTYMSGYKTLNVASKVLDSIYTHFHLKDKQLTKYPTLAERKLIIQNVSQRMKALTEVFDYGTLALIGGKFDISLAMFQTIVKEKFPSCEIYNNIGLIYLLKAIKTIDKKDFPYVFPCEIDATTRLKENSERSITDETEENLKEAIRNFELALKNKTYSTAWLNKAIAEFLLNRPEDFAISLKLAERNANQSTLDKIAVLNAIILHKNDNKDQAISTLKSISPTNIFAELNFQSLTKPNYWSIEIKSIKTYPTEILPILQFGQKIPAVDFFSSQVKSTDSLKYILKFERNLSKMTVQTTELNYSKWYYKAGEIKPTMVIVQPINVPNITLNNELVSSSDLYFNSSSIEFLKMENVILKFQNKQLINSFYLN
jgi:hypothetical protein